MTDLWFDFRYALRTLRRAPGFAVAVIATLALGIGANTTIFSAIHSAVLADPPFPQPDQLWIVQPLLRTMEKPDDVFDSWSWPLFEAFRQAGSEIGEVAAFTANPPAVNLSGGGRPQQAHVEMVTANYLPLLGVTPVVGRAFAPDEDQVPGAARVAMVGYQLWRGAFGGDPGLVGRNIQLNGAAFRVIGILPAGFAGLSEQADVLVPMMMAPTLTFPNRLRGAVSFWHQVIARIPDDRTDAEITAALAAAARAGEAAVPLRDVFGDVRLHFARTPLATARTDPALSTALFVLLGAVDLVLLIACVNVTNLLLARSIRRRREIGVRVALGVGRGRLARQLLLESLVLAALGGVAGLLIAVWGLDALAALGHPGVAGTKSLTGAGVGGVVLWFDFATALVAGITFGTVPALAAARQDPRLLLRGGTPDRRSGRLRRVLVAAEVALALVLLAGAGLLIQSFARLQRTELGFTPDHVMTAYVNMPSPAYDTSRRAAFYDQVVEELAARPGVRHAAVANCLPVAGRCDNVRMTIADQPLAPGAPGREVWMNMVSPGFFPTMGLPIRRGRSFGAADRDGAPRVAIVSSEAARRYWPNDDALGKRIQLSVGWGPDDDWAEVVGVAGDVSVRGVRGAIRPGVYLSFAQYSYESNYLVASADGDPAALAGILRDVVLQQDPDLPLWQAAPMTARVEESMADTRFSAVLLVVFAAMAVLLAAVGIYGVVAFSVAGRTREIGIRVALGAHRLAVLALVFREGFSMVAAGLVTGVAGALLLAGFLGSQLYGIAPRDPATLVLVSIVLALVAAVAIYVPARRAVGIEPIEALRHE